MSKNSRQIVEVPRPVGHFAVMRHGHSTLKNMRFSAIHDNRESAVAEAMRLAAEAIATDGAKPMCYYVVEITDRFGIVDGKFCSGI